MRSLAAAGSQGERAGRLFLAGVVVMFLPQLPFGNFVGYPFVILATWFHEMGHGLAALLLGHEFDRLVLLTDGSGYTEVRIASDTSGLERALIAAAGPLAPCLFGAGLILASARQPWWGPAFYTFAAVIAISVFIWVRSLVGLIVLPSIAALLVWTAQAARPGLQRFALQFVGLLAALSMFRDWDYLFSESAVVGGQVILSDTGAIAAELVLPYWFWAGAIIGLSAIIIGVSLKIALVASAPPRGWRPR